MGDAVNFSVEAIDELRIEPDQAIKGRDLLIPYVWIAFNREYTKLVDRCIEPMIVPPPPKDRGDTDIAFLASCIVIDGRTSHLYFSRADKMLFRAVIRRS